MLTDVIDCSGYVHSYTMRRRRSPLFHPRLMMRHSSILLPSIHTFRSMQSIDTPPRLRCALPQPEPDQALLAELRRLPQVHPRQG